MTIREYKTHNSLLAFYLAWQTQSDNSGYNLCFSYQLHSLDEADILVDKLQELINSRPFLRQTFKLDNEILVGTIHDRLPAEIRTIKISMPELEEAEIKLIKHRHDLSESSSIHVTVINFEDADGCILFFNIHHILMDGITLDSFLLDLNVLIKNKSIKIESPDEYINKLESLSPLVPSDGNIYIKKYIDQIKNANNRINYSFSNTKENFHYLEYMPEKIYLKLKIFSEIHSISIFNLLLLAQGVFYCKIFNQDFSLIHYPVSVRKNVKIDGCLINLFPFPLKIEKKTSYLELIKIFKENFLFLKSLNKIDFSCLSLDPSIIFAQSNFAQTKSLTIGEKEYKSKSFIQLAHSLINIKFCQRNNSLIFNCDVKSGFLQKCLSDTILVRFFGYLTKLLDMPQEFLINTDLLFYEEKEKLLYGFSNTSYPKDKSIDQLFEEQCIKNPEKIAISYKNKYITYAQLNENSDQVAFYLKDKFKISSREIIGLCFDRSEHLIIAMISILKVGCAYVSLHPSFLNERSNYILKNSKTNLLLTESKYIKKIDSILGHTMNITKILIDKFSDYHKNIKTNNYVDSKGISHLIYTSGTTGLPKGVMITHKNVISLVKNTNYIEINNTDTLALLSDITFDASTFEIWGALLNGAKLFIPDDSFDLLADIKNFKKTLDKNHVTILWLTKTIFDHLYQLDDTIFSGLKYLLTGGESLNKYLVSKLAGSKYKPKYLINGYGPTENTTFSCFYKIDYNVLNELETVPIGVSLSNRTSYVLDRHMNLLPMGAIGELYVGGDGLSLGYWNQPELTDKKFVKYPFSDQKKQLENTKLYKTGDLARMLSDFTLECLGRNDFQVKIRGYRVELSEIENRIMSHPDVKQAVVLQNIFFDDQAEEKYLAAYYVSNRELNLLDFLIPILPDYMLPKIYIHLLDFPKTNTGKLDMRKLPKPLFLNQHKYVDPRNLEEKIICDAFSKVLNGIQVGINDDFFHIGGNSIKAITLTSLLLDNFHISVADIFNKKTPEKIAKDLCVSQKSLKEKINSVKYFYKKINYLSEKLSKIDNKSYLEDIKNTPNIFTKKSIKNILLTGATGYLGVNILYQLLKNTDYNIFMLIRGKTYEMSRDRINKKFYFYFNEELLRDYDDRIKIYSSDIEKEKLGLSRKNYKKMENEIDTIVHAAAITKHYGEDSKFFSANVQATINLLELAALTQSKSFHHISTISVLHDSADNKDFYTENDFVNKVHDYSTVYIKSKHEAETFIEKYRKKGVSCNIYRVGNLAFILKNFSTQENIEDNAFYNRIKCFIMLHAISNEISKEEISPVDITAQAIIKILEKNELQNKNYHVFNPFCFDLIDLFSDLKDFSMKFISLDDFLDLLINRLNVPNVNNELIMRFFLHQGWLDGENKIHVKPIVLQNKTNDILKKLGFEWPIITKDIFLSFINKNYFY